MNSLINHNHGDNVVAFIGFFVFLFLVMVAYDQVISLIKSHSDLKKASQIKVGGVLTKRIPKEELPTMPMWANMHMENRETGKILPVCSDKTGFWHYCEGKEPVNLDLSEWSIKNGGDL